MTHLLSEKIICFDLEGPLSPMDHAYEVMSLIPEGKKLFEVLSRYDDILTLERREGYEPGDTLRLLVPFLLSHHISEEDLEKVSREAKLVKGAQDLIAHLQSQGWKVQIISTSYCQHALSVAQKLGVDAVNVACTHLPLRQLAQELKEEDLRVAIEKEGLILDHLYTEDFESGKNDDQIRSYLDQFFWEELSGISLGRILDQVEVVGGRRKVRALEHFLAREGGFLQDVVVVGDSITDCRVLEVVEAAGGLAIVFNGNRYALSCGTIGVASGDMMRSLRLVLEVWQRGGRKDLHAAVREGWLIPPEDGSCHWLPGASQNELDQIVGIHKKFRSLVRGEAAKLG